MKKEEKVAEVLKRLKREYPDANGTDLNYENPFQLLVATILSAQSTDSTVNQITPKLFEEFETPEDFEKANLDEITEIIYSSGFYRRKAKWIRKCCKKLVEDYNSQIPRNIEELTKLRGVARKTANVVLSEAFGIDQRIAVDTHVKRLSKRIGFSQEENREKIERKLMKIVPKDLWYDYTNLLIKHGREICDARNPLCKKCVINDLCSFAFNFD